MEEHDNHPADRYFQENLSFHESDPSRKVWNNIANELDRTYKQEKLNRSINHFILTAGLTGIFVLLNFALTNYSRISGKTQNLARSNSAAGQVSISSQPEKISPGSARITREDTRVRQKTDLPQIQKLAWGVYTLEENDVPLALHWKENQNNIVSSESGLAQNNSLIKLQPGKRGRISIEPFFLKEFAGYNFADNDIDGEEIEKRERTMFSATVGVLVNYSISRHWLLQTGLAYSMSESNIDSFATYAKKGDNGTVEFRLNTVSGYSFLNSPSSATPEIGDSVHTNGTHSHLKYISVPLIVSYRIPMKKFSALIGAGATFNVLSSAVVETDIYDANFSKHESWIPLNGLKKTNFGVIVKAEFSYQMEKRWNINLLSSFKNTLGPINLNSAISAYPYNFGVGLGMTYQF